MPQNHSCNCAMKTHADPLSSTLWVLSRMESVTLPPAVCYTLNQPLKKPKLTTPDSKYIPATAEYAEDVGTFEVWC